MTLLITLILLWSYTRPFVDIDNENNQIIIHYNWRGVRKTYVIR